MTSLRASFGKNLTAARKKRGLSREKLSELVKIDPQSIRNYEKGARWPDPEVIEKLANALVVPPRELLETEELVRGVLEGEADEAIEAEDRSRLEEPLRKLEELESLRGQRGNYSPDELQELRQLKARKLVINHLTGNRQLDDVINDIREGKSLTTQTQKFFHELAFLFFWEKFPNFLQAISGLGGDSLSLIIDYAIVLQKHANNPRSVGTIHRMSQITRTLDENKLGTLFRFAATLAETPSLEVPLESNHKTKRRK